MIDRLILDNYRRLVGREGSCQGESLRSHQIASKKLAHSSERTTVNNKSNQTKIVSHTRIKFDISLSVRENSEYTNSKNTNSQYSIRKNNINNKKQTNKTAVQMLRTTSFHVRTLNIGSAGVYKY